MKLLVNITKAPENEEKKRKESEKGIKQRTPTFIFI